MKTKVKMKVTKQSKIVKTSPESKVLVFYDNQTLWEVDDQLSVLLWKLVKVQDP